MATPILENVIAILVCAATYFYFKWTSSFIFPRMETLMILGIIPFVFRSLLKKMGSGDLLFLIAFTFLVGAFSYVVAYNAYFLYIIEFLFPFLFAQLHMRKNGRIMKEKQKTGKDPLYNTDNSLFF